MTRRAKALRDNAPEFTGSVYNPPIMEDTQEERSATEATQAEDTQQAQQTQLERWRELSAETALTVNAMVGMLVARVMVSPGEHDLAFITDEGSAFLWRADGDCCSESWFADIVGVEALLGARITSVQAIDLASLGYITQDGRTRQEEDRAYGHKITTTKGWVDIVMRNSSNGYYGGDLHCRAQEWIEAPTEWRELIDDLGTGAAGASGERIGAWRARLDENAIRSTIGKACLLPPRAGHFKSI